MLYFIALFLLETVLFVELGLLFLRVLGRKRQVFCELGKSCWSLQCVFTVLARLIGYSFLVFAAVVLVMGVLQVLAVVHH